jgi:hypothetical protein
MAGSRLLVFFSDVMALCRAMVPCNRERLHKSKFAGSHFSPRNVACASNSNTSEPLVTATELCEPSAFQHKTTDYFRTTARVLTQERGHNHRATTATAYI